MKNHARRGAGALALCTLGLTPLLAGCVQARSASDHDHHRAGHTETAPRVVTADIQAGIERHIEERTRAGNGSFAIDHEGGTLRLRLVRVHTEYLANLGPDEHFACVDLVNDDGRVFDVDFFLTGPAGGMRVTETIVHKLNGKPYYVWEQRDDSTWARVSVENAGKPLLGVIEGEDRFRFTYRFDLPELADGSRVWLPIPETDDFQTVTMVSARTPVPYRTLRDTVEGNAVMFMELGAEHSGETVAIVYDILRREKSAYDAVDDPSRYLRPNAMIPPDPIFAETASRVLAGKTGEMVRARALYDHVVDSMDYQKVNPGYGRGDALYACDSLSGNCTDYHSYFIALARAAGIPARFAIGAPIPSERNAGGISGYHCWAEFHADGKWWPVDISESDKYAALSTYYFGHHPANRLELSRGRDLVVTPGPASGPINMLAYPVIERDGRIVPLKPFFSFERQQNRRAGG